MVYIDREGKNQSSYPIQTILAEEGKKDVTTRVRYIDETEIDLQTTRGRRDRQIPKYQIQMRCTH
jgi:hypothetical protein